MSGNTLNSKHLSKVKVLITGGAGFIGSHIVDFLMEQNLGLVRVVDNLSSGSISNIEHHMKSPNFEFINGDIRDYKVCVAACSGIDVVNHQAAMGSVPRSINDPITTNSVNISGFLNMINASKDSDSVERFVYASSSSVYGENPILPKKEGAEGKPISPYALTKSVNEQYAEVFFRVYGLKSIGLRYFNIYGPRQNPEGSYAAVIPKFCKNVITNTPPNINGNGLTSRDFTYVSNAVQANYLALFTENICEADVYNVACGEQYSLNDLIDILKKLSGKSVNPNFLEFRQGDILHSQADIRRICEVLDYQPDISFEEGLARTFQWYCQNF